MSHLLPRPLPSLRIALVAALVAASLPAPASAAEAGLVVSGEHAVR